MKKMIIATAAIALALPTAAQAKAVEPGDMHGLKSVEGQIGLAWLSAMFMECDNPNSVREMFEKYVSRDQYYNHPVVPGSDGSWQQEMEAEVRVSAGVCAKNPVIRVAKVVSSGDLVVIQASIGNDDRPNPSGLTEWFRIKDGKIVDHWDMSRRMESKDMQMFENRN